MLSLLCIIDPIIKNGMIAPRPKCPAETEPQRILLDDSPFIPAEKLSKILTQAHASILLLS